MSIEIMNQEILNLFLINYCNFKNLETDEEVAFYNKLNFTKYCKVS